MLQRDQEYDRQWSSLICVSSLSSQFWTGHWVMKAGKPFPPWGTKIVMSYLRINLKGESQTAWNSTLQISSPTLNPFKTPESLFLSRMCIKYWFYSEYTYLWSLLMDHLDRFLHTRMWTLKNFETIYFPKPIYK